MRNEDWTDGQQACIICYLLKAYTAVFGAFSYS